MLLGRGADVNAADDDGQTALMDAAEEGYADVVEVLLRYGAKVPLDLQGNVVVEVAIKAIAEDRANHHLVCYGINQSLTAKKDADVPPVDSKEFNPHSMSMLPTGLVVEIATMSAASDMSYALASRIAQNVIDPQEEEKEEARAADAGSDDEKQQSTCEQIMTNCVIS
jgi:hypothetical protein